MDLRPGLPGFSVVGLPDIAVQEARERVRSGVVNQAFALPPIRIIANLAPADLRKAGPQYDLPIALALLCASSQVRPGVIAGTGAAGELALDGALRPVPGALVMAEHAARRGWRRLVVPAGNAAEASLVPGIQVLGGLDKRRRPLAGCPSPTARTRPRRDKRPLSGLRAWEGCSTTTR